MAPMVADGTCLVASHDWKGQGHASICRGSIIAKTAGDRRSVMTSRDLKVKVIHGWKCLEEC